MIVVNPGSWLPILGGILFSLGLLSVVILAGWSWLWSSGPSQSQLYARFQTYLATLKSSDVASVIKEMKKTVKGWKGGGPIAQAARTTFLKNCDLALLKVHKDKDAAIQEFMDALRQLLDGLQGLVWLGFYLEMIYALFTMGSPGSLALIKGLAQTANLARIVKLIEQIEKLDSVKDKVEKAQKMKELKEALEGIKGQIPETSSTSGIGFGAEPYPFALAGDFRFFNGRLRSLFASPLAFLGGCSPIALILGFSGLLGLVLIVLFLIFGGFGPGTEAPLAPVGEDGLALEDGEDLVTATAPEPTSTPVPTETPVPSPTPNPIDVILSSGNFSEEQKAQILIAYALDPEGDWIYSIANEVINNPIPHTDIRGHTSSILLMTGAAVNRFFNQSLFPCGSEIESGFVVCTSREGPVPAGRLYMFVMKLAAPVPPGDPDHFYTYAAVVDADGDTSNNFQFQPPYNWDYFQNTDRWYALDWNPEEGRWKLSVTDIVQQMFDAPSAARAVVMGDLVVFFVPGEELPAEELGYRLTAFGHDGTFAPNASSGDVTGADPTEPLIIVSPMMVEIEE